MARKHNPFAKTDPSILETPWGSFEVCSPNKERLAEVAAIQEDAKALGEDPPVEESVALGLRTAAAGLVNGAAFLDGAKASWDAGDLTLAQIQDAATFVSEEMRTGAAEGNA